MYFHQKLLIKLRKEIFERRAMVGDEIGQKMILVVDPEMHRILRFQDGMIMRRDSILEFFDGVRVVVVPRPFGRTKYYLTI